jgi:hypothetical protein
MNVFKKLFEEAFELLLKTLSSVGKITDAARDIKVSVRIQNLIEDDHKFKPLADKAKQTWTNLLEEKSRCQLEGLAVNVPADLTFTICEEDGDLVVKIDSQYLQEKEAQGEFGQVLKEFIEETNKFLDELLNRNRSLTIDVDLASANETKQVYKLCDFFQDKLRKVFFSVLVRKFISEVGK